MKMFIFLNFFIIMIMIPMIMIPTVIIVQKVIEKIKNNIKDDLNAHKMSLGFEENYENIPFIPDVKEVSNIRCKRKK